MTKTLKWTLVGVVGLVVAIVVAAGFVVWPVVFPPSSAGLDAPGGSTPGSVVSARTFGNLTPAMRLLRAKGAIVTYRSTAGQGRSTSVTGAVFVPGGDPPAGGWPVIAYAHGTTGINEPCGPTQTPDLKGGIALAQGFVGSGYAVAMADYQGLGAPGVHPYLDAQTAGRNVIDSVRALRTTFDGVSDRWVGFGASQGGGASWAANEVAGTYAPELSLLGSVNAAPAADVVGLVAKARAGTLTADQGPVIQWVVESAARSHPDIVRDDYRSGTAARYWDVLSVCSGPQIDERARVAGELGRFDFAPHTDAAATRLTDLLGTYAVARRRATAPMIVVYGTADTYIDSAWTTAAVGRACALGDTIDVSEQPGKGHADVELSGALGWMKDRFAGRPAPDDCGRVGGR